MEITELKQVTDTFLKDLDTKDPEFIPQLTRLVDEIGDDLGIQHAYNLILRTEVVTGNRKPKLAIYDHAFHFLGGAQKYGLTLVHKLKSLFDVTIISNKPVSNNDFKKWYGLDFSDCEIKILPIPFFEKRKTTHLDPSIITRDIENPFHRVSIESGNYDLFINNSMNEMVYPLTNISVLICHFPERRPSSYFYADQYSYVVYNSKYTAGWIEKRWGFVPHQHIYPPVDMDANQAVKSKIQKEKLILSVARFEESGTKKQKELVSAFIKMNQQFPKEAADWKFVLIGGSTERNRYLDELRQMIQNSRLANVEIFTNVDSDTLKAYYQKATLFWHLCGLNQTEPEKVEHFGMTIVEAMQNRIVPIVFNGGGQKEIVDHNESGYRVKNIRQLVHYTIKLITDPQNISDKSQSAFLKSQLYTREKFEEQVYSFFNSLLKQYRDI